MSSINLFLLGLVKKKPISAYDLAKFIDENQLNQMIKISDPAVYKNLIKLKQKGLLRSKSTQTENMPEKTVYSITKKGEDNLNDLVTKYARQDFDIHFDFNSFIINLDFLSKEDAVKKLHDFKNVLLEKKKKYECFSKEFSTIPFVGKGIVKQFYKINDTLIDWLEEFTLEYLETRK